MTVVLAALVLFAIAAAGAAALHPFFITGPTDARALHRRPPAHQELALEDVA